MPPIVSADSSVFQIPGPHVEDRIARRELCLLALKALKIGRRPSEREAAIPIVTGQQWAQKGRQAIQEFAGKTTQFEIDDIARIPQTIVPVSDLDRDTRRLVKVILDVSQRAPPKNVAEAEKEIDQLYQQALNIRGPEIEKVGEATVRSALGDALGASQSEAGAWVIELKDGRRLVAPHHSHLFNAIKVQDMMNAFNAILAKKAVTASEISSIHFLHNHPGNRQDMLLLSAKDESVALSIRQLLDRTDGGHIDFQFSSIAKTEDGSVWVTSMTPERAP